MRHTPSGSAFDIYSHTSIRSYTSRALYMRNSLTMGLVVKYDLGASVNTFFMASLYSLTPLGACHRSSTWLSPGVLVLCTFLSVCSKVWLNSRISRQLARCSRQISTPEVSKTFLSRTPRQQKSAIESCWQACRIFSRSSLSKICLRSWRTAGKRRGSCCWSRQTSMIKMCLRPASRQLTWMKSMQPLGHSFPSRSTPNTLQHSKTALQNLNLASSSTTTAHSSSSSQNRSSSAWLSCVYAGLNSPTSLEGWERSMTTVALAMGQKQSSLPSSRRASSTRLLRLTKLFMLISSLERERMKPSTSSMRQAKRFWRLKYFLSSSSSFLKFSCELSKKMKGQQCGKSSSSTRFSDPPRRRRQTCSGISKTSLLVRLQISRRMLLSSSCCPSSLQREASISSSRIAWIFARQSCSISSNAGMRQMNCCFSPRWSTSSSWWNPSSQRHASSCPNLFSSVWLKPNREYSRRTSANFSARCPWISSSRRRKSAQSSRCTRLRSPSLRPNLELMSQREISSSAGRRCCWQQRQSETQLSRSSLLLGAWRCSLRNSTAGSQRRSWMQCTQKHSSRSFSQLPAMQNLHTNRFARSRGSFFSRSSFSLRTFCLCASLSSRMAASRSPRQVPLLRTKKTWRAVRGGTTTLTSAQPRTQVRQRMKSPNLQKVCDFSKPSLPNHVLNMLIVKSTPGHSASTQSISLSHCSRCMISRMRVRAGSLRLRSATESGARAARRQRSENWQRCNQRQSRFLMKKSGRWWKSLRSRKSLFRASFSLTVQSIAEIFLQSSASRSSSPKSCANLQCSAFMMHSPRRQNRQKDVFLAYLCSCRQPTSFSMCSCLSSLITVYFVERSSPCSPMAYIGYKRISSNIKERNRGGG